MTRRLFALALLAASAFAAEGIKLPRPAPELSLVTPAGTKRLSSYRGKIVVLNFLLTTCDHCQVASKALSQIQDQFATRGVQVLGGAFDTDSKVNVTRFTNLYAPNFPVGLVDPNEVPAFTQLTPAMKPTAPVLVFIDRTGTIRSQFVGQDQIFKGNIAANIRAELSKYLK